jgi:hypothetical protein
MDDPFMKVDKGCLVVIGIIVVLAAGIAVCGYYFTAAVKVDEDAIEAEAREWVDSYNDRNFSNCYDRSDSSLKKEASLHEFRTKLTTLYLASGKVSLLRQTSVYVNRSRNLLVATSQWDATSKQGEINVVMLFRNDVAWRVTGFIIRNKLGQSLDITATSQNQ